MSNRPQTHRSVNWEPDAPPRFKVLSADKEHKLKLLCPYCGGGLTMSVMGCTLDEQTGWVADSFDINCDREPDIDGPNWEDWWQDHSFDYCDRWHRLHDRLERSLAKTHRVKYDTPPQFIGSITGRDKCAQKGNKS